MAHDGRECVTKYFLVLLFFTLNFSLLLFLLFLWWLGIVAVEKRRSFPTNLDSKRCWECLVILSFVGLFPIFLYILFYIRGGTHTKRGIRTTLVMTTFLERRSTLSYCAMRAFLCVMYKLVAVILIARSGTGNQTFFFFSFFFFSLLCVCILRGKGDGKNG